MWCVRVQPQSPTPYPPNVPHTHNREYLTGFSKRKQERRRFGLAMQKIKDRKARLAGREEVRAGGVCGVWDVGSPVFVWKTKIIIELNNKPPTVLFLTP